MHDGDMFGFDFLTYFRPILFRRRRSKIGSSRISVPTLPTCPNLYRPYAGTRSKIRVRKHEQHHRDRRVELGTGWEGGDRQAAPSKLVIVGRRVRTARPHEVPRGLLAPVALGVPAQRDVFVADPRRDVRD